MSFQVSTHLAGIPDLPLRDYLRTTKLPEITADRIYILDAIPHKKLANAIASFAQQIRPNQAMALVDDTAFGSGKDGLLVSDIGIHSKQLFQEARWLEFERVHDLRVKGTTVFINNREFVDLTMPHELPLAFLISEIETYLQTKRRNAITQALPRRIHGEESAVLATLLSHSRKAPDGASGDARRMTAGHRPGFYVADAIAPTFETLVRFFHGIDLSERIYAAIDLGNGCGHAIVFTSSAIYFSYGDTPSKCLAWDVLVGNQVQEAFRRSIFIGVRLKTGEEIICSRVFGDDFGYAFALFSDLINALTGTVTSQQVIELAELRPTAGHVRHVVDVQRQELMASMRSFKDDANLHNRGSELRTDVDQADDLLAKHSTFVLDRVVTEVSQHFGSIGQMLAQEHPSTRTALAQVVTFIVGAYVYGTVAPEFVDGGEEFFFQVAAVPLSYLEFCRHSNSAFELVSSVYKFLDSDEGMERLTSAMYVQHMAGLTQTEAQEVREAGLRQLLLTGQLVSDEATFDALRHSALQIARAWLVELDRDM